MSTPAVSFSERLWPAWWVVAVSLGWSVMLAVAVGAATNQPAGWLVLIVVFGVCVWAMWRGAWRVAVTPTHFTVGPVRLPLEFVADVVACDTTRTRELRGVDAHARAFTVLRGWIATSVCVSVNDPADPTPYWLVSSRRPTELATALTAALAARGSSQ